MPALFVDRADAKLPRCAVGVGDGDRGPDPPVAAAQVWALGAPKGGDERGRWFAYWGSPDPSGRRCGPQVAGERPPDSALVSRLAHPCATPAGEAAVCWSGAADLGEGLEIGGVFRPAGVSRPPGQRGCPVTMGVSCWMSCRARTSAIAAGS